MEKLSKLDQKRIARGTAMIKGRFFNRVNAVLYHGKISRGNRWDYEEETMGEVRERSIRDLFDESVREIEALKNKYKKRLPKQEK